MLGLAPGILGVGLVAAGLIKRLIISLNSIANHLHQVFDSLGLTKH